jgi:hypothetical protein
MALAPINPTNLTPPRVEFIDPRSGAISREWYRFFLSLLNATESNQSEVELAPDTASLLATYDSMLETLTQTTETQPDCCASGQAVLASDIQALALTPPSNGGTVTSVDASGGTTGLTFSGGPITTSGTLTLGGTLAITNGGTGATTAAAARTNLGASTLGSNVFTITNPSAVTFPRFNADNTVSALDAASFRTAIGAGTGGGSVTSVSGTGTVNGLTLTGTVTTSGSLTLGGTLSNVSLTTQVSGTLPVANGGTGVTTSTGTGNVVLSASPTFTGTLNAATISATKILPNVQSIASASTITPNADTDTQVSVTALAVPATIASPSGTPSDGQSLVIRIEDNGTGRALTWTTGSSGAYRAVGITLPTTTVATKVLYVGCKYNSTDLRWDAIALSQEA